MKLDTVPAGFQDVYIGEANEAFENPRIENHVGDGKVTVEALALDDPDNPEGKKNLLKLTAPAGTVGGNTSGTIRVDGHVGEGEAPVDFPFDYDTVSPDATTLTFGAKVRREPIPA